MAIVQGSFTGTGSSATLSNKATLESDKKMTFSLSNTFAGTVDIERSYDAGASWNVVKSYTAIIEENLDTPTDHFIYRVTCSAYTSGTMDYALAN
jgi:hypothetical protein